MTIPAAFLAVRFRPSGVKTRRVDCRVNTLRYTRAQRNAPAAGMVLQDTQQERALHNHVEVYLIQDRITAGRLHVRHASEVL